MTEKPGNHRMAEVFSPKCRAIICGLF